MAVQKLRIADFLRIPQRGFASTITDPVQLQTIHSHDYYELFLVNSGHAAHYVNGQNERLYTGCVCLVRPDDVHCYRDPSPDFQIINILVDEDTIQALFAYLGETFEPDRLLKSPHPPTVAISQTERTSLMEELEQLVVYREILKDRSNVFFKITLLNMITKCFPLPIIRSQSNIPDWLRLLCLEMLKKENFVDGLPAMRRLSNKSVEHLSRTFRKFLGKSPTQFINEVRIMNAARLIRMTQDPIISIGYEVGFNNLSNFYHLFKGFYGISPGELRKDSNYVGILDVKMEEELFDTTLSRGVSPF